jgi:glycerophosphoryl diester phosphodiesterase
MTARNARSAWATAPLVVGHRGGRGEGWPPENTIEAFEQARAQGARAIELDVRTCAGAEVVVFHDASLERMAGGGDTRRVCDVRLEQLRAVDLGGGARVPTLSEALAWASDRGVAVNIEMKHDVPDRWTLARATARCVRDARADVLLSSFDPTLLALAAAALPRTRRALLVRRGQPPWAQVLQRIARPPLVQALHLERTQTDPRLVAGALGRGLRLGVWTVNDPREAVDLVAMGVASIITDRPGDVLTALRR